MPRDIHGKPVLTDMQRSKSEKKRDQVGLGVESSGPDYPYGLRIDLDHNGLKKLGFKDLPEVGHEIELHAKAHIISASAEKREGRGEDRRVGVQITHLGIKQKEEKQEKSPERKRH